MTCRILMRLWLAGLHAVYGAYTVPYSVACVCVYIERQNNKHIKSIVIWLVRIEYVIEMPLVETLCID